MSRKLLLASIALALLVLVGGAAYYVLDKPAADQSSQNTNNNQSANKKTTQNGKTLTVEGTVMCLSSKGKSGPQVTSCGMGLKTDDGTIYALGADDPAMVGTLPTGQRVKLTGKFEVKETGYESVGLLHVTSVEKL